MQTAKALLLAAAALAALPAAAIAQVGPYDGPPPLPYFPGDRASDSGTGNWNGSWDGEWENDQTYHGVWSGSYVGLDGYSVDAEYRGTFIGESRFLSDTGQALYRDERGWREERYRRGDRYGRHPSMGRPDRAGPGFGYSYEQRSAWLDQCSGGYRGEAAYDDRPQAHGAAIGGVLGAIGGGIAGNRIAGRGDRLEGTLIGAGVGGLAGAALGSAIGSQSGSSYGPDRMAWCEDYLARYEAGSSGYGYGSGMPAVTWVRVPLIRERSRGCGCEEVIEEWVEVQPAPRARRTIARPAPDKRVRYVK